VPSEIPNPRVVVVRGGQVLSEHELPPDGEVLIGRTVQCQVAIQDSTVSRMHARVYADGQAVYLEDLGSANGTFVDGERVMGTVRLTDGQIVRPGQKSVAGPTVLRFEDPAKRLLEEMGLLGTREPTPPPTPKEARTAPAPAPAQLPPGPPPPPTVEIPPDEPPVDDEPPSPPPKRRVWPLLVVVGLLGLVAVAGFLWWAARVLKPASAQWETVQLSSQEVSPGAQLVLQSTEIQAGEQLQVRFGEQPVPGAQVQSGRLTFTIPELQERPAGSYPVPLSVRQDELEVFAATLSYTVRPQIDSVEPVQVRVGENLTITGRALPDSARQVEVTIGTEKAQVVEATTSRLVVRVPLVTRDTAAQLPIVIRSGDWEARPAVTLVVLPKVPQPLDFAIEAVYRENLRAWDLSSPVAPLFLFHAPPPGAGGAPPAEVVEVQSRLRQLFTLAAEDPALRVEAVATDGRYRLRASSPRTRPWPVVDLTEADLVATARARQLETTPDLFAFWMARVWNHLLATFARGEKPAESSPAYLPVLARLVDANVAAGGTGRPEAADLEVLSAADRNALADAFFTVPAGQGSVAGRWTARLQNLFYPEDDYVIELQLDLTQRGRNLSGTGTVFIQSPAMTMRVPQTSVSGTVQPGLPPKVKLRMSFARPIGNLELEGVFEGGTLQGAYSSSMLKQPGTWQAVR
jgi:hypothetical protein